MTSVLIIDDDEMSRDLLARRLQSHGFTVSCAEDGPDGVKLAHQQLPDLILMDLALTAMNGLEATRLIKTSPRTAAIPVIALTAHIQARDQAMAKAAGCEEFVPKPVDISGLLNKISRCLSTAKARAAAANE